MTDEQIAHDDLLSAAAEALRDERAFPTLRELGSSALKARLIAGGPNPMCSLRTLDRPHRFNSAARQEIRTPNDVGDMICMLLAAGRLTVHDVLSLMDLLDARALRRLFFRRAVLYRLVAEGDIARVRDLCEIWSAEAAAGDADPWVNWRVLGEHHVAEGDLKAFVSLWPRYVVGEQKWWIEDQRVALVEALALSEGWEAAVRLVGDRRIGTRSNRSHLLTLALAPLTTTMQPRDLADFLDEEAAAQGLSDVDRTALLIRCAAGGDPSETMLPTPDADHPDLPWILERVRAVDPGPKKTDRRLKDFLFMELKALIGDEATYRAVKAEVKAPAYRREFGTSVADDRASAARWATMQAEQQAAMEPWERED